MSRCRWLLAVERVTDFYMKFIFTTDGIRVRERSTMREIDGIIFFLALGILVKTMAVFNRKNNFTLLQKSNVLENVILNLFILNIKNTVQQCF